MAFRAPRRPVGSWGLERAIEREVVGGNMPTQQRVVGIDTSLLEQDERNAERMAKLAMTPGVMRGGSTTPGNQRFDVGGQTFSFDPVRAAEIEGRAAGIEEAEAQRAKFEQYQRIPGVSPSMASKLVYGRGGVVDEELELQKLRAAQAAYQMDPTREMAARAIGLGANPSQFPERYQRVQQSPGGGEMSLGMQDYLERRPYEREDFMFKEDLRHRNDMAERAMAQEQQMRNALAEEFRSARSNVNTQRTAVRGMNQRRPNINQPKYKHPTIPMARDTTAFDTDMQSFRADSAAAAGSLLDAENYFKGLGGKVTPAAPAPAASSREQKLWDDAVRKYGRQRVEAEFGPRP